MIRIQLASNYQVVELTYESWDKLDPAEVKEAVALANTLGKEVENNGGVKKPNSKPIPVNKPSEKQIAYAVSLGIPKAKIAKMTAKELHKAIAEAKD